MNFLFKKISSPHGGGGRLGTYLFLASFTYLSIEQIDSLILVPPEEIITSTLEDHYSTKDLPNLDSQTPEKSMQLTQGIILGSIFAELGNNFFQVATTLAFAWDHHSTAYFPELVDRLDCPYNPKNVPLNYSHVFFRCNIARPEKSIEYEWEEPSYAYHIIPYHRSMRLKGYFQSEKYFIHHRTRLLDFFAPGAEDLSYLQSSYKFILEHPCTVGIQMRWQYEDPSGKMYIQYGEDYLKKIMKYFPEDALYVVSSNNMQFVRENIPPEMKNVFFIEHEPHYIDFFLLSLCKHNVITNSTFGWWSAWLNQNPNQIVIAPAQWYHPNCTLPTQDLLPSRWIKVQSKWGALEDPNSYR